MIMTYKTISIITTIVLLVVLAVNIAIPLISLNLVWIPIVLDVSILAALFCFGIYAIFKVGADSERKD